MSGLTSLFFSILKPLTCCLCSTFQVQPLNEIIVSRWGVTEGVLREPGRYTYHALGLEMEEVYVGLWVMNISDLPVNDKDSFPCYLSSSYNYRIVDVLSATYKVADYHKFVKMEAKNAMQKIFSEVSYDKYNEIEVESRMRSFLENKVSWLGIRIDRFSLLTLKIDMKIPGFMAKQKAETYVNGRMTIAQGATSIVKETLDNLGKQDISLTEPNKNGLATHLIYTLIQSDDVHIRFFEDGPSAEVLVAIHAEQQTFHKHQKLKKENL